MTTLHVTVGSEGPEAETIERIRAAEDEEEVTEAVLDSGRKVPSVNSDRAIIPEPGPTGPTRSVQSSPCCRSSMNRKPSTNVTESPNPSLASTVSAPSPAAMSVV